MALLSTGKVGFLVAAVGAAHFAAPEAFEEVTKRAFPENTKDWVMRNGATETGIGLAMMLKKTRKLGVLGLLGYTGWLGYNAVNAGKLSYAAPPRAGQWGQLSTDGSAGLGRQAGGGPRLEAADQIGRRHADRVQRVGGERGRVALGTDDDPALPFDRRGHPRIGVRVQPPLQMVALDDQRTGDLALLNPLPVRPDVDEPGAVARRRPRLPADPTGATANGHRPATRPPSENVTTPAGRRTPAPDLRSPGS